MHQLELAAGPTNGFSCARGFRHERGVEAQVFDVTAPEFDHPRVDVLVKDARPMLEKHFHIVELTDTEVGLVYKNDKLAGVLAQST